MAKPPLIKMCFNHIAITRNKLDGYDCNRITFINKGTQNVTIDSVFVLAPNDAVTYPPDYPNEVNTTKYNIIFDNDQLPGCKLIAIVKVIKEWP